jgi:arabinosaccharide transport system substrate-binding protein
MEFPPGKAPFALLVTALLSGLVWLAYGQAGGAGGGTSAGAPDLVMAIFAKEHRLAYEPVIREFEKEHGVHVQLQVVEQRALDSRLQAALQVGADVPDVVELLDGSMGTFTQGPLKDVGFVDLTDRVEREGLRERVVISRFTKWSSRGRIFALPHDVHPVMLAYRRDIVESLGIDVTRLTTWDEFARVGRQVVSQSTKGGITQHYMIDLDINGSDNLRLLLLQANESLLNSRGDVAFDTEGAARVLEWYVRQNYGAGRTAFSAGWGQTLAQSMGDGLVLFYFCPDWRSRSLAEDVKQVAGKMALMPLPAWQEGGRRTSTWGGTGLAITKACKKPQLAWELAMRLYYRPEDLGHRFAATNILPPLKAAWTQPEFDEPRAFFGGQRIGREYIALAPQVPEEYVNSFLRTASAKFSAAYVSSAQYFQEHGEEGFHAFVVAELKRNAQEVRRRMARNPFLMQSGAVGTTGGGQ